MSTSNVTTLRRPDAPSSSPSGAEAKVEQRGKQNDSKVAFSFRDVVKTFGDKPVLRGIDLDVREGEFLAIIGKSGCGKSTLLRILAGLDAPTSGTVSKDASSRTRMMFQEPRLLPWERIANNVSVGLTGIAKGEAAKEQALAILEEVGLKDRAGEWPYVLSGGQKQRVALARAASGPSANSGARRTSRCARCAYPHRNAASAGAHLAQAEIHRRPRYP
jgi:sulfonate transport system ATP-binding protein